MLDFRIIDVLSAFYCFSLSVEDKNLTAAGLD